MNWLNKEEYPFQSNYMDLDGHKLHYIDEGKGKVMLFVHGTPSWSFEFRHLITEFSKSFRCIAFDHIGFGLSDKPKQYEYKTQKHSENLEKLINYLDIKEMILTVHDFGGPIGLNYAIKFPDKIDKLIIFNTWLWSSQEDPDYKKLVKILKNPLLPFLYKYFNFSAKFLIPKSFADKSKLTGEIHKNYTGPFGKPSERLGTLGFANSLINDQDWFESLWRKKERINSKPTLFIWGMKDSFISPKYLENFEKSFLKSKTVKIDEAGHFPHEESKKIVIEEIRSWLSEGTE